MFNQTPIEREFEKFRGGPTESVGWRINASPFCKHFGIRPDATLRFIKPDINGGRLILKLGDVVITRQHRRKKKNPER